MLIVAESPKVRVVGGQPAPFYKPHYIYRIECHASGMPAADVHWFTVPCTALGCVSSEPHWQPYTTQPVPTEV